MIASFDAENYTTRTSFVWNIEKDITGKLSTSTAIVESKVQWLKRLTKKKYCSEFRINVYLHFLIISNHSDPT